MPKGVSSVDGEQSPIRPLLTERCSGEVSYGSRSGQSGVAVNMVTSSSSSGRWSRQFWAAVSKHRLVYFRNKEVVNGEIFNTIVYYAVLIALVASLNTTKLEKPHGFFPLDTVESSFPSFLLVTCSSLIPSLLLDHQPNSTLLSRNVVTPQTAKFALCNEFDDGKWPCYVDISDTDAGDGCSANLKLMMQSMPLCQTTEAAVSCKAYNACSI